MSKDVKVIKRFLHQWGYFALAIIFTFISHLINENLITINVLLSNNAGDILKSTITFASIISGFSGSLIGQLISAKNSENKFLLWYFEISDAPTLIFNIKAGVVSAFALIGSSIFLLSYIMLDNVVKSILTYVWVISLFSFILYQINNYILCLKLLLFIPKESPERNKTQNLNEQQKQDIFKSLQYIDSSSTEQIINVNSLKK